MRALKILLPAATSALLLVPALHAQPPAAPDGRWDPLFLGYGIFKADLVYSNFTANLEIAISRGAMWQIEEITVTGSPPPSPTPVPSATPEMTPTPTPTPAPSATSAPTPAADPVLVAAGDIAACGTDGAELTARLLDQIEGTVLTLGDNAYDSG